MKKIVCLLAASVAFAGAPMTAVAASTAGPAAPCSGSLVEWQSTEAVLAAGAFNLGDPDEDPETDQADAPTPVSGAF